MKIKHISYLFVCFFTVVGFSQNCPAGAWTQKKNGAYVRSAVNYYYANENFDQDGNRDDMAGSGRFQDINANVYCEYGLTDTITFITSLYYKYLGYEDNTIEMKSYGIGDIDLGAKYKFFEGTPGVFSVQTLIKIPAYDEEDRLPLGNGQTDIEARLLYGRSLWPNVPGYVNGEIGYRFRLEEPSDEFRYLLEFGLDFSQQWYSRIKLDGILSMENSDSGFQGGSNPQIAPEFDLGKLDLVVGYKVTPVWSIEIGVEPDIYGKNISAGTKATLAVAYKRD